MSADEKPPHDQKFDELYAIDGGNDPDNLYPFLTEYQVQRLQDFITEAEFAYEESPVETSTPDNQREVEAAEARIFGFVNLLLAERAAEIAELKVRLRDIMPIGPNRQPDVMPAIFSPLDNPTPEEEIAIWWLNGHSENEAIIDDGDIERLPEYLASEVHSLHGRPTRGRLWVPEEIQINEIQWDETKPRAKDCADRGGIVFWRKDLHHLAGLPGFVTDTRMNEIEV